MVKISILYIWLFVSSLFTAAQVRDVTYMTKYGLFRKFWDYTLFSKLLISFGTILFTLCGRLLDIPCRHDVILCTDGHLLTYYPCLAFWTFIYFLSNIFQFLVSFRI